MDVTYSTSWHWEKLIQSKFQIHQYCLPYLIYVTFTQRFHDNDFEQLRFINYSTDRTFDIYKLCNADGVEHVGAWGKKSDDRSMKKFHVNLIEPLWFLEEACQIHLSLETFSILYPTRVARRSNTSLKFLSSRVEVAPYHPDVSTAHLTFNGSSLIGKLRSGKIALLFRKPWRLPLHLSNNTRSSYPRTILSLAIFVLLKLVEDIIRLIHASYRVFLIIAFPSTGHRYNVVL